jgi:hypothetical protein
MKHRALLRLPVLTLAILFAAVPEADAQRVAPTVWGGGYKITVGQTEFIVAPSRASRIRSFKHDGTELLYQADSTGSPGSMGSTFWTSPQEYWTSTCRSSANYGCWTPPAAYDGPTVTFTGGLLPDSSVTYTGASADTYTKARLRKTFWGNPADTSITIRYHMVNTGATKNAYAGWEVSRFTTGGLTFYAKSDEDTVGLNKTNASSVTLANMIKDTLGVKWHKYDSTASLSGGTPKFWDGTSEGWYAHVDKRRLLYIKKFQDIPTSKKAPGGHENQIEYYTNNNTRTIVEMELQGPFDSVAAGDSLTWDVKWYVRLLPDSIPVTINSSLLSFTRETVNGPSYITSLANRPASQGASPRLSAAGDRIALALDRPVTVSLEVMDARGAVVQRPHSGPLDAGESVFRITPAAKGLYWVVLRDARGTILETRALPRL